MNEPASSRPAPEPRSTTLDLGAGVSWRLHTWGHPETATPLVIALHGFSGSGLDWELPVATLNGAAGAWIAPDLPGHGGSTGLPAESDYSLPAIRRGLLRLVRSLPRPPILIGYSMGGRAALEYAVHHSDTLAGLLLIGATAGIEDPAQRAGRARSDASLAVQLESEGIQSFAERWEALPLLRSQREIPEPWGSRLRARRRLQVAAELARSLRAAGQGVMKPLWPQLPQAQVPTRCIAGINDAKFGTLAAKLADSMPSAAIRIIPAAGHAPQLENTAQFCQSILPWCHQSSHSDERTAH